MESRPNNAEAGCWEVRFFLAYDIHPGPAMHLLGLAFENVNGVWEFCALLIIVRPSHALQQQSSLALLFCALYLPSTYCLSIRMQSCTLSILFPLSWFSL
jgi:hypothetical protein